jgi:hypothetical protein
MSDELRPEAPEYPARLRRIREQLDEGLAVYVDHCEYGTSKKLVLIRATALTGGNFPPVWADYLFLGWLYSGSMWVPEWDIHWDYIAGKLQISKWPGDAKSVSAFLQNLGRVGTGLPMVKADDL